MTTIQTDQRQVKILATNGLDENRAIVISKSKSTSYYEEHRLALMEYSRNYYAANKQTILQKKKDNSQRNRDRIAKVRRLYYQLHKDAIRIQQRQYRDNKKTQQ
jgi:hypothetical protein